MKKILKRLVERRSSPLQEGAEKVPPTGVHRVKITTYGTTLSGKYGVTGEYTDKMSRSQVQKYLSNMKKGSSAQVELVK